MYNRHKRRFSSCACSQSSDDDVRRSADSSSYAKVEPNTKHNIKDDEGTRAGPQVRKAESFQLLYTEKCENAQSKNVLLFLLFISLLFYLFFFAFFNAKVQGTFHMTLASGTS